MPEFTNDSLAEGLVFVGATGATGDSTYTAVNGDIVLATGGATGAGGVVVTLPNIVTVFPLVAVQPPVGSQIPSATGATNTAIGTPSAPDADSLCVSVHLVAQGASGTGVQVITADGSLINGASGGTGITTATVTAGWKFVSKAGNWYTV
jgi:hypothetical protein